MTIEGRHHRVFLHATTFFITQYHPTVAAITDTRRTFFPFYVTYFSKKFQSKALQSLPTTGSLLSFPEILLFDERHVRDKRRKKKREREETKERARVREREEREREREREKVK